MELDELAALKTMGNQKKRKELFEKQLQMLINDNGLYHDFKERFRKSRYIHNYRGFEEEED